jgi:aspartyl-tRNA synthetase
LEIEDLSEIIKKCEFKVFAEALKNKGVVRAITAPGAAKFTRKELDELIAFAQDHGAKGLAYIIVKDKGELQSPIVKFLGDKLCETVVKEMGAGPGDVIFFGADKKSVVEEALGQVRLELGRKLNLIDENTVALAFVLNQPLFEEEKEDGHYAPSHHMFTMPKEEDIKLLDKDPSKVKSYQHDLVANGYEIGGGSVRIHEARLQAKIFDMIGFDEKKKQEFSHFLTAFKYGVPPHGGIAPGLDRVLMVLMNQASIRDVMAFPKTGDGRDLMMEAPSEVDDKQLKELNIKLRKV